MDVVEPVMDGSGSPLAATEPPELRGVARDLVRLMVVRPGGISHGRFRDLPSHLGPGDVVVVNTSATVPAAVDGQRAGGRPVTVHVAGQLDDPRRWVVELRHTDGRGPVLNGQRGEQVRLPGGVSVRLERPRPGSRRQEGVRLWEARANVPVDVLAWLAEHGRPITYGYLRSKVPLAAYQPVFARRAGSAEMASAGRPFTERLVVNLVAAGVHVAPVTLHTSVSSLEAGERPEPERFEVPGSTAEVVNLARAAGHRVVAVGTTVTRALESAADDSGEVRARDGWTDLLLGPRRPARVVTGLVTGWHDDGSTHLDLLRAVAGSRDVEAAYAAAYSAGYRWHEFGDACLFLPTVSARSLE